MAQCPVSIIAPVCSWKLASDPVLIAQPPRSICMTWARSLHAVICRSEACRGISHTMRGVFLAEWVAQMHRFEYPQTRDKCSDSMKFYLSEFVQTFRNRWLWTIWWPSFYMLSISLYLSIKYTHNQRKNPRCNRTRGQLHFWFRRVRFCTGRSEAYRTYKDCVARPWF